MPRKKPRPVEKPAPPLAPAIQIHGCTITAQSGQPATPEVARAVERLAEAVIQAAKALQPSQPGVITTGIHISQSGNANIPFQHGEPK